MRWMVVSVVGQVTGMAAVSNEGGVRKTLGLLEKPKPSLGIWNMLRSSLWLEFSSCKAARA